MESNKIIKQNKR